MSQSRKGSIAEVITNIFFGYFGNVALNMLMLPLVFGVSITVFDNIWLGVVYTIWSVVRGYILRRVYNRFNWFAKPVEYCEWKSNMFYSNVGCREDQMEFMNPKGMKYCCFCSKEIRFLVKKNRSMGITEINIEERIKRLAEAVRKSKIPMANFQMPKAKTIRIPNPFIPKMKLPS